MQLMIVLTISRMVFSSSNFQRLMFCNLSPSLSVTSLWVELVLCMLELMSCFASSRVFSATLLTNQNTLRIVSTNQNSPVLLALEVLVLIVAEPVVRVPLLEGVSVHRVRGDVVVQDWLLLNLLPNKMII